MQGSGNIVAVGDVHIFHSAPKQPRLKVLAYKGDVRYRIYVGDLRKLSDGYSLGNISTFQNLMKLPSIVQTIHGKYAFPNYKEDNLSVVRQRSEDFNDMLNHWYLSSLIEELRATNA